MCTRCNQKYGGTADSQDSIALGSGLHGDFAAMACVLHTAKLQKKYKNIALKASEFSRKQHLSRKCTLSDGDDHDC